MDNLIIVESPTKAKTISKFTGEKFKVEATMGHIRDLPENNLGIDLIHNFKPEYIISEKRKLQAEKLKSLFNKTQHLILATDPDREGEAIAWHISYLATEAFSKKNPKKNLKISRIVFHEITKEAILAALENPREIDLNLVDAQQARRVLDRLVGYKLSPLLWKKIRRGLSAGRVQSVALKLIVEKDREIEQFKSIEYWDIEAELRQNKNKNETENINFKAQLAQIIGSEGEVNKIEIRNKEEAEKLLLEMNNGEWLVKEINKKEIRKNPFPPFMTSTLQQAAGNKFGWSAKKTMQTAQSLYEAGYITYHRTDSLNLSFEILDLARLYIKDSFGEKYLPEQKKVYKTKSKVAQEAHEAIRPTKIKDIEEIKPAIITEIGRDGAKLYDLVWRRFISCQMNESINEQTTAEISINNFIFKATGQTVIFDGWKRLYNINTITNSENETEIKETGYLPLFTKGEKLSLINILPEQHFTQPPAKYTEASLIKALEEKGIGRPSTYAPIISTIIERRYVEKMEKKFTATVLGIAVCDFLMKNFSEILDYDFTAKMEDSLDQIANGEIKWTPVVKEFYLSFVKDLKKTEETAQRVKIPVEETEEKCDLCGANLVIRLGRYGKFLACSRFPECKFTKPLLLSTGLTCPKCSGMVIIRRTKRGKQFYGCSNYPKCDFASWLKPEMTTKIDKDNEKSDTLKT